ncbi:MAG: hypothetical protein ACP5HZ_10695 [Ferrimicrobium sp.]
MQSWHPFDLLGEAVRNVTARTTTSILVGLIVALVALGVSSVELFTARSVTSSYQTLIADGYTTVEVTAGAGGAVLPARTCSALNGQVGVVTAGGVGPTHTIYANSEPSQGFLAASTVGNAVGALTTTSIQQTYKPGVILSRSLATSLGDRIGGYISISNHTYPIAQVVALGNRDPEMGGVALLPRSGIRYVAACFVQFTPGAYATGVSTLLTQFASVPNLATRTLVPHSEGVATPGELWNTRESRYLFIAGGIIVGLFLLLVSLARRHELAVYLISGSTRTAIAIVRLLELNILLWSGALVATAWFFFIGALSHATYDEYRVGLIALARVVLVSLSLGPLGLVWLVRNNLVGLLKQRAS